MSAVPDLAQLESVARILTDSTSRATGGPVTAFHGGMTWLEGNLALIVTEDGEKWRYEIGPGGNVYPPERGPRS